MGQSDQDPDAGVPGAMVGGGGVDEEEEGQPRQGTFRNLTLCPQSLDEALKYCNYVFTIVFVFEAVLKLVAFGFRRFFKDRCVGQGCPVPAGPMGLWGTGEDERHSPLPWWPWPVVCKGNGVKQRCGMLSVCDKRGHLL